MSARPKGLRLDLADLGWTGFLPKQWEFFNWQPSPTTKLSVELLAGGWGAGKTEGVARKFAYKVLSHGWQPQYKSTMPVAYVAAPTWRVMRHVTLPVLESLIPPIAIRRKRQSPSFEWELVNNVKILFVSADSEFEGTTCFCGWLDEIQHANYWSNPKRFSNFVARLRDKKCRQRTLLASGLPESGRMREAFDKPDNPAFNVVLTSTYDNFELDEGMIDALLATCPAGLEDAFIGGKWQAPAHAIYAAYDTRLHLTPREGRPERPVHLGMDVGNGAAVVIGQDDVVERHDQSKTEGLLIVDEQLFAHESVEAMCMHIRDKTPWRLEPGTSVVCVDPNTGRDQIQAVKRVFGKVKVVRRERGDETFPVKTGIRYTQRALKDAHGDVRLRFSKRLQGQKHGILDGIQNYRWNPISGQPVKDNLRDHVLDALRYLVAFKLPPKRIRGRVQGEAERPDPFEDANI